MSNYRLTTQWLKSLLLLGMFTLVAYADSLAHKSSLYSYSLSENKVRGFDDSRDIDYPSDFLKGTMTTNCWNSSNCSSLNGTSQLRTSNCR